MNSENNIPAQDEDVHAQILVAMDFQRKGDLNAAISIYKAVLDKYPENAEVLHLLGVVLLQAGDYPSAEQSIRDAIQLAGNRPHFHANLGAALAALNNYQEAEEHLELSLRLNNEYLDAYLIQGKLFLDQNKTDNAIHTYKKILTFSPDHVDALVILGEIFSGRNEPSQANGYFERASALSPDSAFLQFKLAMAYLQQGQLSQAVEYFLHGLELQPSATDQRRKFFKLLGNRDVTNLPDNLLKAIESTAGTNGVDNDNLAHIALTTLFSREEFRLLYKLAMQRHTNNREYSQSILESDAFIQVANNTLLIKLLEIAILRDARAEVLLTVMRSAILFSCVAREEPTTFPNNTEFVFTCGLAIQCFNNEYAYIVRPDETELLTSLIGNVTESSLANESTPPVFQIRLALLSMYLPLSQLSIFGSLPDSHHSCWLPAIRTLIKQQVDNVREETGYHASLNSMSGTIHAPSQPYLDQYDAFPYPRWLSVDYPDPMSLGDFTGVPYPNPPPAGNESRQAQILVAGCGTGREAIAVAAQFPDSRVLAIDFSPRSLSYARRMAAELGFSNIDFQLSDILNLKGMNREFSLIICNGVLHHLSDPVRGWKILVDILEPGGYMNIGVYSEKGRHAVNRIRYFLGVQGSDISPDLIRKTRRAIIRGALSADKSEKADTCRRIVAFRDFYSLSQCRFLLFDLPEHLFSIPELKQILALHHLCFSHFCNIPPARLAQYREMFSEDTESNDLDNWNQFEAAYPDTFQEMYNFWCQKPAL